MKIENFIPDDLPSIHALNQSAVPEVSSATINQMERLIGQAGYLRVVRANNTVAGFLLAMGPGQDYRSENYRWFSARYDDFLYIDRVVIAEEFRSKGIGTALYRDIEEFATGKTGLLACEVNVIPPNPGSLAFHHRLGFSEAGQQDTEGGQKRVSLLTKALEKH